MTFILPPFSLVLGGAASGKSDYAERLVSHAKRPLIYIATAQSYDDEMSHKIALHQSRRGANWRTVEAPLDLTPALASATKTEAVLIDCATMWLSNQLFSDGDLATAQHDLFKAIKGCAAPVVMVSNEVGAGIVPENALARKFRQAQGELNQDIAARADLVVAVMAGLPLALKGQLPSGASW
jgi:adenosylcobinamide kinase/adenosylcobinamide-phosphate guanylyltransferase